MLNPPPLALYVHLPWCARKCPYCDFNSHVAEGDLPFKRYRLRLLEDLEQDLGYVLGRPLQSVFFGGGTPSLFPADEIAALLDGIRAHVEFSPAVEITLEANPGSAESGRFRGYRAAGVNRLSIGVQSFDEASLLALGRIHGEREARSAIDAAHAAGFSNFNVDLMHGLPGQTEELARSDLRTALQSGAPHLSWYQLTIEPNTRFHNSPPRLPAEESLAAIQDMGESLLAENGLRQYEVSAYARSGYTSVHNQNYWNFGDYLGIGAGAHGKLTLPGGGVLRTQRTRVPRDYLAGDRPATPRVTAVEAEELPLEYLMNALRLRDGTPTEQFLVRAGPVAPTWAPMLDTLRHEGLLDPDPERIRASELGFKHLDAVLARLA